LESSGKLKLYKIPLQKVQPVTRVPDRTREGGSRAYRFYPSWSTDSLVAFHGLVSSSIYLCALASAISEARAAQVVLPDLRGHGEDRHNLEWPGPLSVLQDFEEIFHHFRQRAGMETLAFLGHSLGASWALKILSRAPEFLRVQRIFLLAPYIQRSQIQEGWFQEEGEQVIVGWPESLRTGQERTVYPQRFLADLTVHHDEIEKICARTSVHVIETDVDEIVNPLGQEFWLERGARSYKCVPGVSHMGLVMDPLFLQKFVSEL
jgi:pimeloyl-ACP methyl ester carboxylesterase